MPKTYYLPDRVNAQIQRPPCPNCLTHMMLARIMPARPGFDLRWFECPKCNHVHEVLVANEAFGSPFTPSA
jgi:hypothetical protein